jgi:multiple sugar transport system permease protein
MPVADGGAARVLARREARTAWALALPALALLAAVTLLPLVQVGWESLHLHDLRMPWRGTPLVGLANYADALRDGRLLASALHTLVFTVVSVALELVLGFALALALHARLPARGAARTLALLPWAVPTVVAGLVFRFLFDGSIGAVNTLAVHLGLLHAPRVWLADPVLAWIPLVLADVWKTTPFVAFLLLAGLQSIDPEVMEAARVDGAGAWSRLRHVILPGLLPSLAVAAAFRALDALRIFDLVYVLTNGGPGTATETLALYVHKVLLQDLRFGYGSALSVLFFVASLVVAAVALALVRRRGTEAGA